MFSEAKLDEKGIKDVIFLKIPVFYSFGANFAFMMMLGQKTIFCCLNNKIFKSEEWKAKDYMYAHYLNLRVK